ncbi:MAG: GAF domain-containing protein, partial [Myxococcales bacterium]|nr:GAF domain-containing protein [Myxococcales bacterium]
MQTSDPPSTVFVSEDDRSALRRERGGRRGEAPTRGMHRAGRLFFDDEAIGVIREHLFIQLGADMARGLLTAWGYELGRRDAQALGRPFSWDNDAQLLLAGPRLSRWIEEGIARMETRRVSLNRLGAVDVEVMWHGCPEAMQHVDHLGRAEHAVCWTVVGYYSGYCSTLLSREVVAVETTCAAMGADCCTIRLRGHDAVDVRGGSGLLQPWHATRLMQAELERLRFESSMRLNRLEALREAVLDVTSDLDLEGVQAKIVSRGRVLLGARYGFLVLFTDGGQGAGMPSLPPDAQRSCVIIHDGLSHQDAAELEPFPIHTGLFAAVLYDNATIRVRRISDDPRSRGMPDRHHALISGFLGVPLRIHGQLCGALYFTDRLDGGEFTLDDEKLAESFAAHASVALENARLVETIATEQEELRHALEREQDVTSELHKVRELLEREREMLKELVEIPSSPDIDSALHLALGRLMSLLQADVGAILLPVSEDDDEGDGAAELNLQVRASLEQGRPLEIDPADAFVPATAGLSGRVARTRDIVYVRDVLDDPEALEPHLRPCGVRSLLAAPLMVKDRLIGVVQVGSYAVRTFETSELRFLRLAAHHTAMSIEHARLHQRIRRSDKLLRAVLEAAPIGLAVTVPPHGATLISNGVMRRLEEVARHSGLHPAGDAPLRALRGETVRRLEQNLIHPTTGTHIAVRASAAPVIGEGNIVQAAVTVVEELTLEKEIERLREQFVSLVAHDLRNPLNAAMMHLELLRERLELARRADVSVHGLQGDLVSDSLQAAEAISRSLERVSDLASDLLDYSRLQAGQLAVYKNEVPLQPLVRELLEEMRPLLQGRAVVVEMADDLPPLRADRRRLAQVLTNLLSNAVKYTPPKVRIGLRARCADAQMAALVAPLSADERHERTGSWVLITVWDEGPGIPAEVRPRIFDPFYRLSRDRERRDGTGLGLYITRGLCEAHGGQIWIDNVPGASFSMLWPAVERDAAVA